MWIVFEQALNLILFTPSPVLFCYCFTFCPTFLFPFFNFSILNYQEDSTRCSWELRVILICHQLSITSFYRYFLWCFDLAQLLFFATHCEEFINIITNLVTFWDFTICIITSEVLTNQSISKGSWAVLLINSIYVSARHCF